MSVVLLIPQARISVFVACFADVKRPVKEFSISWIQFLVSEKVNEKSPRNFVFCSYDIVLLVIIV